MLDFRKYALAVIREEDCIGCAKCLAACPVDAIIGAPQQLHTVLVNECIGCQLCVPPCPVDCIEMVAIAQRNYDPAVAKKRHQARKARLQAQAKQTFASPAPLTAKAKQAAIQAAIARVQAQRKK